MKVEQLKPLNITEKEVGSMAWGRTIKKHTKAFVLLCLPMLAVMIVWLLPTKMNEILHTIFFIVALICWLAAMYDYFNPKYQKIKKELLEEWAGE